MAMLLDIMIIFGLLVAAYLPQNFRRKDSLLEMTFTFNIILIVLLILGALNFIFNRKSRIISEGVIEFLPNSVLVNNREFLLKDIKNIRLKGNDIKGDFRGFKTKGLDNELQLELENDEKFNFYFQQTSTNQLKYLTKILENYVSNKTLSKANFDNIMNNTNYY